MNRAIVRSLLILVLTLVLAGCEKAVDVIARVTDRQGRGLAGAVFYCEAWQYSDGAYDFAWGVADSSGVVRMPDGLPMKIRWRSDAKLGVAVMATGKRTFAVNDYTNTMSPEALEFVLDDTTGAIMRWEPKLAKLGFPFEKKSGLAERLRREANLPLLRRIAEEYSILKGGTIGATPEEMAKMAFLTEMLAGR